MSIFGPTFFGNFHIPFRVQVGTLPCSFTGAAASGSPFRQALNHVATVRMKQAPSTGFLAVSINGRSFLWVSFRDLLFGDYTRAPDVSKEKLAKGARIRGVACLGRGASGLETRQVLRVQQERPRYVQILFWRSIFWVAVKKF